MSTITVGLNSTSNGITVNPITASVTYTGTQGVTWAMAAAAAGWSISSVSINTAGSGGNGWGGGTPAAVAGSGNSTWAVSDVIGNPTATFTYMIWINSNTSLLSLDPEIVNAPPGW